MRRRHVLLLPAAILAGLHPARAADNGAGGATAFIQSIGRELPAVLKDAATDAERRRRLEPFLRRVVDLDRVARFCLGRYWRIATPAQQQEYESLFTATLTAAIASRAGKYNADTKVITKPEIANPDGTYVPTIVSSGSETPVQITWVVDTTSTPFHILDVQAQGISLRLSQRSDYVAFLDRHNGDIDAFLRALREHAAAE